MADTTYATIDELRAQYGNLSSDKDSFIQDCLNAAAEMVDKACNWNVPLLAPTAASARMYVGSGMAFQPIDPCVSITTLEIKENPTDAAWTAVTAGTYLPYRGEPRFPDFNSTPYNGVVLLGTGRTTFPNGKAASGISSNQTLTINLLAFGLPTVRVTARFGYGGSLPPQAKLAVLTQASRWVKRGESAWADTLADGNMGQLQYRKSLDPDVRAMLELSRLMRPSV